MSVCEKCTLCATTENKRCSEIVVSRVDPIANVTYTRRKWCDHSTPMVWGGKGHNTGWYGTAHNWLRVCEITDETVVWNKKCNAESKDELPKHSPKRSDK